MSRTYVGNYGVEFLIDMGETISAATDLALTVVKPSGEVVTWTPTISGTNFLRYVTADGDQDEIGTYYIQPSLTLSGWVGEGVYFTDIVYPRIDDAEFAA